MREQGSPTSALLHLSDLRSPVNIEHRDWEQTCNDADPPGSRMSFSTFANEPLRNLNSAWLQNSRWLGRNSLQIVPVSAFPRRVMSDGPRFSDALTREPCSPSGKLQQQQQSRKSAITPCWERADGGSLVPTASMFGVFTIWLPASLASQPGVVVNRAEQSRAGNPHRSIRAHPRGAGRA